MENDILFSASFVPKSNNGNEKVVVGTLPILVPLFYAMLSTYFSHIVFHAEKRKVIHREAEMAESGRVEIQYPEEGGTLRFVFDNRGRYIIV